MLNFDFLDPGTVIYVGNYTLLLLKIGKGASKKKVSEFRLLFPVNAIIFERFCIA